MIVRAAPHQHYGWLCERLSTPVSSDMRAIEAVDSAGEIVAMVGYHWWRPNSVTMLFASDQPLVWRALLPFAFRYPFETREILRADVPSHSAEMLRVVRRLGFVETHRVKDGFMSGDDVIEFEMRKQDCRFIGRN